jgi:hypothetical protein
MQHVTRVLMAVGAVGCAACGGGGGERSGTETGAAAESAAAPVVPEKFEVANVMIGKRIGTNNLITEPTFQFAPADTVYVSVGTTGKSDGTNLVAVWHYQDGKMIDSTAKTVSPEGPENNEFHVASPKGWKPGTYKVTIYADGDSVDARTFAVKK